MGRKPDFLTGTRVVEEVESPINGEIQVIKSLAFGTYIQVGDLTQSGGVVRDIWRTTLKETKRLRNKEIKNCLILGLGGGSAAKLVRKYWPEAEVTGVEIDPLMIELGRKYMGLDEVQAQVHVQDAYEFCKQEVNGNKKYDLVCVDVYVGDKVPDKFESEDFLELILELINPKGLAIFNRLYFDEKRKEAEVFHRKLIHVFRKVRPLYPEANVMYICSI